MKSILASVFMHVISYLVILPVCLIADYALNMHPVIYYVLVFILSVTWAYLFMKYVLHHFESKKATEAAS